MDGEYVCSLDDVSLKKAYEELREDPKERNVVLAKFREIISQNKWLKTPTDSQFLLAFLRVRKFSIPEAVKTLESYWSCRTDIPEWFHNVDLTDPDIQKILKYGMFLPIPGRDSHGRKVLLIRVAAFDPSTCPSVDVLFKALFGIYAIILRDECTQVNGFVILEDVSGFSMKHHSFFGLDSARKSIRVFTKGFPGRYKQIIYYNADPVFLAFFALMKSFLPEKLINRLQILGKSLVPLYEWFDKSMLPEEYLPDDYKGPNAGSLTSLVDQSINEFMLPENVEYLKNLSSGKYGIDKSLKPKNFVQESFRFKSADSL